MKKLEWKRVYKLDSRKVSHYVAESAYYHMTLQIWPMGGFVTVKRFVLEIYHRDEMVLRAMFFKKKIAAEWADTLFGEGGATIKAIQLMKLYS